MSDQLNPADPKRFIPVHVDSLDNRTLQLDLYIRHSAGAGPTLYRAAGLEFAPEDAARLIEQGQKILYILAEQHAAYRRGLVEKLERTFSDETLRNQEKARLVRASCERVIQDVLLLPGQGEAVEAVAEVSRAFGAWADRDAEGFGHLLDMSQHDFGTATHMMNVGVGCGLLARHLHPGDNEAFQTFVMGGMLHDLGKRGIPPELLNKEGRLSDVEFEQIRAHPGLGHEELSQNKAVPQVVLEMVRDHHEKLDGTGYPRGRRGEEISIPARVCAIVDVFDAITAARPYRGATPPADTLRIMAEGQGRHFDPELFAAWRRLVKGMCESDPTRAIPPSATPPALSLGDFMAVAANPVAVRSDDGEMNPYASNRRRFDRLSCRIKGRAWFVRCGKAVPVRIGEPFPVAVIDISRGGAMIEVPWAMSLDDVLVLELPGKDERIVRRNVRVARPGRQSDGSYRVGLQFVGEAGAAAA